MTKEKLTRYLNSVGKLIFTEYYDTFNSYANGKISKENCIEILVSDNVSNDSGAAIRCSNAKLIFENSMQCGALEIIIKSKRLSVKTIQRANALIVTECKT